MVQVSKEQTVTAGDGKTYKITVTYDADAGIPEDAELQVSELDAKGKDYQKYVKKTAKKLESDVKDFSFAHAFDIALVDPETGEHCQPTKPLSVSVKLLKEDVSEDSNLSVVHFGEETEVLESSVKGESVEFETNGFSVYVVIEHEGDTEVKTPRVEFHFIDSDIHSNSDSGYESLTDGQYQAAPFRFINKANTIQTSQILKDGESLEMIANPPNLVIYEKTQDTAIAVGKTYYIKSGNDTYSAVVTPVPEELGTYYEKIEQYFYGWYVVNGEISGDDIVFTWTEDPDEISFEKNVSIHPDQKTTQKNGEDAYVYLVDGVETAYTSSETVPQGATPVYLPGNVNERVHWEIDGVSGDAVLDAEGTAHVFLAPVYEDYYFINFRLGPKDNTHGLAESLLVRKLVVLGNDEKVTVRIGGVTGVSPDAKHQVFSGWESVNEGTRKYYYQTVDNEGNERNFSADESGNETANTGGKQGYYATFTKADFSTDRVLDLYPVFVESRWLYFNTGKSGNGATYVAAAYRLTNEGSAGTYFDKSFFQNSRNQTRRNGYEFLGWYVDAKQDANGEITNLDTRAEVVTRYIDPTDNTEKSVTESLTAKKLINADGTLNQFTKTVTPEGGSAITLYEVTSDGRLYFYKPMDDLTVYALWKEIEDTTIQVNVWRQKVSDDKSTTNTEQDLAAWLAANPNKTESDYIAANGPIKTYDYVKDYSYVVSAHSGWTLAELRRENKLHVGGVQSGQDVEALAEREQGFHLHGNSKATATVMSTSKVKGDGSTVVNVYYDRDLITFNFYTYNDPNSFNYTETTSNAASPDQYAFVDGTAVKLDRQETPAWLWTPEYTYSVAEDSNTNTPQFAIVNGEYEELTRVSHTVTKYRWRFTYNPNYYMDTDSDDGIFYTYYYGWQNSGYNIDNPPPDTTETYYAKYGNNYYELTPVPVSTTTYTWQLNGADYNGTRYTRTAGGSYSGSVYTRSGSSAPYTYTSVADNDNDPIKYGVDRFGGHVKLTGADGTIVTWLAPVYSGSLHENGVVPSGIPVEESVGRAVLLRAAGSEKAFFTISASNATQSTTFKMSDLIIDGKGAQLKQDVRGGCLTAYKSDVTIDNCVVYDFEAAQGGAIYTTGDSLTVTDSVFDTCKSDLSGNGNGGGAINTEATTLSVTGTTQGDTVFKNCSGVWQGGAVYHYGKDKSTTLTNCLFEDCTSRSGGAVEADTTTVSVNECVFKHCTAIAVTNGGSPGGNAGGLNNYLGNNYGETNPAGSSLTVTNCTFQGCSSDTYGGGLRSKALTVTLTGCTFEDTSHTEIDPDTSVSTTVVDHNKAKYGGSAAFDNTASSVNINGCTFTNCSATESGGGIYSKAASLTVQNNGSSATTITGCNSKNGGGIYLDGSAQSTLTGSTKIEGCSATSAGGGVYVNTNAKLTMSGSAVINGKGSGSEMTNAANGGSVYVNGTLELAEGSSAAIQSCTASANGGGVYVNTGTLELAEGSSAAIQSCTASEKGGGIFTTGASARVNVKSGSITDNEAKGWGGGAIRVEGGAKVTISGNAQIKRNCNTGNAGRYGGAIGIKQGEVWIQGGTISENYVKGTGSGTDKAVHGGAIFVDESPAAILHVEGGTITGNYASATNASGYAYGGAIYAKKGGVVYLSGGTISGNYVQNTNTPANAQGAGIYLAQGSTLYLSGSPSFGGADTKNDADESYSFTEELGNLLQTEFAKDSSGNYPNNGGQEYKKARQDIYLAGYDGVVAGSINTNDTPPTGTGIVVTDDFGSSVKPGAIWVWAEYGTSTHATDDHIHKDDQFGFHVASSVSEASLNAFRNARTDADTGASSAAYYGVKGEGDYVIWGTIGGAEVFFKKVDGKGDGLGGAKFKLYKTLNDARNDTTNVVSITGDQVTNNEVTSAATAVTGIEVGDVNFRAPIGIHYMRETTAPTGYSTNTNIYIVLVGNGNVSAPDTQPNSGVWSSGGILGSLASNYGDIKAVVNFQRGTETNGRYERDAVIFLIDDKGTPDTSDDKAVSTPDIAANGIMNVSTTQPWVILDKIDGSNRNPLSGAEFDLLRQDLSLVNTYRSGSGGGAFYVGPLPIGIYYVHEKTVPDNYQDNGVNGWWWKLTVNSDGTVTQSVKKATRDELDPPQP